MKKFSVFVLSLMMCMGMTVSAFAGDSTSSNCASEEAISSTEGNGVEISPRISHSYYKTVVKEYTSYSYPEYIYYSEYNMGSNFSGRLLLQEVKRIDKNRDYFRVTYSGMLQGII